MDKKPYKEEYDPLVGYIRTRFQQAETSRLYDEKRWLKAYRNYRGLYGAEMAFRDNEKSKVFVKITKTKVLASFGQIIEVLFGSGKFPGREDGNADLRTFVGKHSWSGDVMQRRKNLMVRQ